VSLRHRIKYKGQPKRQATQEDLFGWVDISDKRDGAPPTRVTKEQWQAYLKAKNRARWYRMRKDFKWAQRMLLKIGVDPEEVRWLL
jgi:hypothetical protein